MLTPGQRYEIGKQAAEHGVTAILCYYAEKYRDLPLSETSMQRFKDLYKDHCQQQAKPRLASEDSNNADPSAGTSDAEEIKQLPFLLPDALDHQVQEYVKDLQKRGLPINTSLLVVGIVMSKYAGSDGVEGSMFNLMTNWAKFLLGRMGYVMRKVCSK